MTDRKAEAAAVAQAVDKLILGGKAFPRRLKPCRFDSLYGAAEAAPFQNKDFFVNLRQKPFQNEDFFINLRRQPFQKKDFFISLGQQRLLHFIVRCLRVILGRVRIVPRSCLENPPREND
jgi:hypothetical protein